MISSLALLITVLLQVNGQELNVTELEMSTNSKLIATFMKEDMLCETDGMRCKDCRTAVMCSGQEYMEIPCRGVYSFCDRESGTCGNNRTSCDGESTSRMKHYSCPSSGVYPDLDNCLMFHFCTDDSDYLLRCNSLSAYNPTTMKCDTLGLRARCSIFSCVGRNGRFVPYSGNPSLYALCINNAPVRLFECPPQLSFDEREQKCKLGCNSAGNMPDPEDSSCTKFYECRRTFTRFTMLRRTCPRGTFFDRTSLKCESMGSDFKCQNLEVTTTMEPEIAMTEMPSMPVTSSENQEKPASMEKPDGPTKKRIPKDNLYY